MRVRDCDSSIHKSEGSTECECGCGGVGCGVAVGVRGCRSVCGAQCVAFVLVISRAGIGPKSEEVCVQTRNGKGKKLFDDKRSNANKLFLALELLIQLLYVLLIYIPIPA